MTEQGKGLIYQQDRKAPSRLMAPALKRRVGPRETHSRGCKTLGIIAVDGERGRDPKGSEWREQLLYVSAT